MCQSHVKQCMVILLPLVKNYYETINYALRDINTI